MDDIRSHLAALIKQGAVESATGFAKEINVSHHTVLKLLDPNQGCQTRTLDKVRRGLERLGHWPPSQLQDADKGKIVPAQDWSVEKVNERTGAS